MSDKTPDKMPSAYLFLRKKDYTIDVATTIEEDLIEFAKMHVEAALKMASEQAHLTSDEGDATFSIENHRCRYFVDKESIINAYDQSNIK